MAEGGANVALAARSDGIYEMAEMIDDDEKSLPVETDVTDEKSVRSSIKETVNRFGGLNCVVNNAGIAGPTKPIEEIELEEWQHTQDVNVAGMFSPPSTRSHTSAKVIRGASSTVRLLAESVRL